jgi:hypothetical protein
MKRKKNEIWDSNNTKVNGTDHGREVRIKAE